MHVAGVAGSKRAKADVTPAILTMEEQNPISMTPTQQQKVLPAKQLLSVHDANDHATSPRQLTAMAFGLKALLRASAKENLIVANDCLPEHLQHVLWEQYIAYRQQAEAAGMQPLHIRKTPHLTVKVWKFGSQIVKEYKGCRKQVLEEIAILQRLHHENLVSYLLVADQGSKISIMMNWAGQSLRDFAAADQQQHFAESLAQHITCQMTRTLVYLHGKGIIHRDIKPDNIGIQPDFKVQLFDWSDAVCQQRLAAMSDKELDKQVGLAGTPLYMAPEALNYVTGRSQCSQGDCHNLRSILTPKLDIWGLGAVLYFLLAGRDICVDDPCWDMNTLADVMNSQSGVELPKSVKVSDAARDFLKSCLQRDPAVRATAEELMQHPWLQQMAAEMS